MTRINALRKPANFDLFRGISGTLNALVFAAVLIVCSIAVGCSSDKPKPVDSNTQISMSQPAPALSPVPAPVATPAPKPVAKKSAPKKPATVSYTDKANGVTFEYPRRYAIETGDSATSIVFTHPVAMNFVAPGGTALAAVELPETGYGDTDFSSAFFSVSVHNSLDAGQCAEFAVPNAEKTNVTPTVANADNTRPTVLPQDAASAPVPSPATADSVKPAEALASASGDASSAPAKTDAKEAKTEGKEVKTNAEDSALAPAAAETVKPADSNTEAQTNPPQQLTVLATVDNARIDLKELPLNATEAVSGEGTRQSDSRYFHVYRNGSCYEFALNVTTNANGDGLTKHIDRDRVFARLEKILDTVKLEGPTASAEVKGDVKADSPASSPSGSPAQ